jgi:hypothetical protein
VALAAWVTAALRGEANPETAATAGLGPGDEPAPDGADLTEVLHRWRRDGMRAARVVLPAPADPVGLPGPSAFNALACDAGECVIAVADSPPVTGLLPRVLAYGSDLEPGRLVGWYEHPVKHRPVFPVTSLAEADQGLRSGLLEAVEVLTELDVTRDRPGVAERWADLSAAAVAPRSLPPGTPARAVAVLTRALRLRGLLALALTDDGGAISGWEAGRRREALRRLDGVARAAVAAAGNAALEPRR